MTNRWAFTLKLDDVFHSEAIGFGNKRDIIVKRIREARWFDPEDMYLTEIVDELSLVDDVDEFDRVWDDFYDWADFNRVWVVTH